MGIVVYQTPALTLQEWQQIYPPNLPGFAVFSVSDPPETRAFSTYIRRVCYKLRKKENAESIVISSRIVANTVLLYMQGKDLVGPTTAVAFSQLCCGYFERLVVEPASDAWFEAKVMKRLLYKLARHFAVRIVQANQVVSVEPVAQPSSSSSLVLKRSSSSEPQ